MIKTTKEPIELPEPTVTRETLEDTAGRVLKFLRGVGVSVPIRAALGHRGYTEADHEEGWALLHAASGYRPGEPAAAVDGGVRDALRVLDAWDEDGFRIVRATLERRYPAQAKVVLDGIGPSTGPAAVLGVKALLDRLDALDKSKKPDDRAAVALLATRGIDAQERARLRALVVRFEAGTEAPSTKVEQAQAALDADHVKALIALRAWHDEWSEIARAAIKRRDHLVLLGLAKRKATAKKASPPAAPND